MGGGASKQRVATLQGHSNSVFTVASYTTQAGAPRVVSGSSDDTIKIWDPETQKLLATLEGHTGSVYAVASYTTKAGAHGRRVRRVPPARRFGVGAVGGRARRGSAVRHVREKPRGRRG